MSNSRIFTIFDKVIPSSLRSSSGLSGSGRSYGRLRFLLLTTMLSITIVPLFLVAGLGYFYYNDLLQNSEREQLEWQLDGSIKSIAHMVDRLESVVEFAAGRDTYMGLLEGENLENLLIRLQRYYGFFADVGVINQEGIQEKYYGPYELEGADYSGEEWFVGAVRQRVFLSRVYTGYRQIPHFAIAVSNVDPISRKIWVLRVTIDAAKLQKFINTVKTDATDDLFLVDDEGVLQTTSWFFGEALDRFEFDVSSNIQRVYTEKGESFFAAIGKIENSPWSLVLLKKEYIHQEDWKRFINRLFTIVLACFIVGILVIYTYVRKVIEMIQGADDMQLAMLKEAEQTDKLASIGRLAAGVGHEINNPLAIINQKTGLVEDLLEMSPDFDHKALIVDNLGGINRSVDRCKAITHRLLGFARRTDVQMEVILINDLIKEVLQFLDNAMIYNRIVIDLQLQDNLPEVRSDKLQLQQVFLNIINNAIDAIGKDGQITITSYKVAGDIRVVIQDNGPGIEPDVLTHIFEPFYTTKEPGKGTGLGLSITYGLIKKLGGDITVRSQIGAGTAFTITIPLHYGDRDESEDN